MSRGAERVLYPSNSTVGFNSGNHISSLNSFVTLEGMSFELSDILTYNMSVVPRCPVPWP